MSEFLELFSYRYFQLALLAALLTSITCGIIGTYIVSRRIVFVSGGISHASFGGIGIGHFAGLNPIFAAAVFAVLSSWAMIHVSRKGNLREDSAIGILWSLGMAVGIIFVYLTPGYSGNLKTYLFGYILAVTLDDILLLAILAAGIVSVFVLFFREILMVSHDEAFARVHHVPVMFMNYLLISLVALTIVFNIRVIGIILVISQLTIPQATASLFVRRFKHIMLLAIAFSFLGSFSGLLISDAFEIPSGAAIIFSSVVIYGILRILRGVWLRRKRKVQTLEAA